MAFVRNAKEAGFEKRARREGNRKGGSIEAGYSQTMIMALLVGDDRVPGD